MTFATTPPANLSSSSLDTSSISDLYPTDCQFCQIAAAYPPPSSSKPHTSWIAGPIAHTTQTALLPFQNHTILSTPNFLAFLDFYRINPGHLLLVPRQHYPTLTSVPSTIAADLGVWLPVLSRVVCAAVGVKDWNVAQNNGVLAKQTVGHVHFHIVPRPEEPKPKAKEQVSWARMRGLEPREEFDEGEGEEIAESMRTLLKGEIESMKKLAEEKL